MFKKEPILNIRNVYTAHAFVWEGRHYVGAGSETEEHVELYNTDSREKELLTGCPGGMMSFLPVPGKPGGLVSIMGLFPPFIGKEAGIWWHQKINSGWQSRKVIDLPFAHRCEFYPGTSSPVLVAASVSRLKENPEDWRLPGEVFIVEAVGNQGEDWKVTLIDNDITRNHGMFRGKIDGKELLCLSGKEGVFSLHRGNGGTWSLKQIFSNEVSEMTFIDLDGDGISELVTIEPFHGSSINVYKKKGKAWELRYASGLEFGHGLSSGIFNGIPTVAVGNRSGSLALEILKPGDFSRGEMIRQVVEQEAGPTQTGFFHVGNTDYILSANQKKNEVALYSGFTG